MPTYVYEALNEAGQPHKGEISAASSEEAVARIRGKGYFPTSVRERRVRKSRPSGAAAAVSGRTAAARKKWSEVSFGGVSVKAITTITRQLSTLQDAGLPILRSISILEQQQGKGRLKRILGEVHEDVSGGSTLSDAMAKHPKAFDKLYTKMIAAGEVGGCWIRSCGGWRILWRRPHGLSGASSGR